MTKNKILKWQIIAVLFSLVLGTLLHFTYEWSGENNFVASFSAANESVWEHLKLVFFPILLFAIIEYFFLKSDTKHYFVAKLAAILTAMSFITIFFYTYTGILGKSYFVLDIASFIISILLAEWVAYQIMLKPGQSDKMINVVSISLIIILALWFVLFTYYPPEIPLFQDPITKQYGISL